MLKINVSQITGRLARDAEVHGGGGIVQLSVAVDTGYMDTKTNAWKDKAAFITVKVFGKAAERAGSLVKGQPVYVEGRLDQENWEKDGVKQSKLVISALSVKPFEVPQKGNSGASGAGYDATAATTTTQEFAALEPNEVSNDIPF